MPVVVVGADGLVGRALVPMLLRSGSEVRAYIADGRSAGLFRQMGAKVAVGDVADEDNLSIVMRDAHTVCHLAGGLPLEDPGGTPAAAIGAVQAARNAGVNRLLLLSHPGASTEAANEFLRGRGLVEEAVRDSGIEHLVLRCTNVYGEGGAWLRWMSAAARRALVPILGPGSQRLAPVFVDDVASALAAADDREAAVTGVRGLQGPAVVTADELVDLLAGRRKRKVHLSPAVGGRIARLLGWTLSAEELDLLTFGSLSDAPDAVGEFGLRLTPLREGLARALGAPG